MLDRRYTFPQVHEMLPPRRDARPPDGRYSQRELVAASLLLRSPRRSHGDWSR